jgi:branched-chain amino acid transport system ATP-binding protein
VLELNNVHIYYGNIHAVKGISFKIKEGTITTLIGANGAGKSTTIKAICGLLHPREGTITLKGQPIHKLDATKIVNLGIGLVPEARRIFPILTVEENLDMGAYHRNDKDEVEKDKEKMYKLFPILQKRKKQTGGSLSGGEQQMLAIARAIMTKPQLLIMDEPSLGLAPLLVKQVFEIVCDLKNRGLTIFLSEQNARSALKIADYGIVMETGKVIYSDTSKKLQANSVIQKAYLGVA